MDFGQRLKELRKKKGLSQAKLARLAEIHHSQIGRYERSECTPSSEVLKKMATALEVSTDYLMEGDGDQAVQHQLQDRELISLFKQVQDLKSKDKEVVKILIEAFITRRQVEALVTK